MLGELVNSRPIQRLKGIRQGGASFLVNKEWNGTRYEHSVGVMLLCRLLGASLEEQIAGLLHDISHTAFSHVIDLVFEKENEDYHEEIFHEVVEKSEIPMILAKHGYDYQEVLGDDSRYNILERPLPQLCADRIDYTLRNRFKCGSCSFEEIQIFLNELTVVDKKLCLQTLQTAEWFVKMFYKEVIDFFLHPLNIYGYEMLANTLRIGFSENVISKNDLLKTDDELLEKLQQTKNKEVQLALTKVFEQVELSEDENNYDFQRKLKKRLIDPFIYKCNQLLPASEVSEEISEMNRQASKKAERGVFIRIKQLQSA